MYAYDVVALSLRQLCQVQIRRDFWVARERNLDETDIVYLWTISFYGWSQSRKDTLFRVYSYKAKHRSQTCCDFLDGRKLVTVHIKR